MRTQAEKDLDAYKTLKAALDHEKAMGIASESKYYQALGELRDKYLTDSSNLSEYRRASEDLYRHDQEVLKKRTDVWKDAAQNVLDLAKEYEEKLTSRTKEIFNSYKLFDEVPERQEKSGAALIENLRG